MTRINNTGPMGPIPGMEDTSAPPPTPRSAASPQPAVAGKPKYMARSGAGRFSQMAREMKGTGFANTNWSPTGKWQPPLPPRSNQPQQPVYTHGWPRYSPPPPYSPPPYTPQRPTHYRPLPHQPSPARPPVPPKPFAPPPPPPKPYVNPQHPPSLRPGGFPGAQPQVRPSRPYQPLRLPAYASSGTQKQSSVNSTEYVRQAAELLIAPDGKLDTTHIPRLIADLQNDRTLCSDHRKHLVKTLQQLQHDPQLAAVINSTCEQKPLRGPAADLVRATLNLPPDQAHLTGADARKAVVMSLLGHLRQGQVGSCFATGPAICMHKEPTGVAMQLKELLQENCLTVKQGNTTVQVPLNKRTSRADAQVQLTVTANGTCYGKRNQQGGQPYKLHQTPGMQGALTALGIPPGRHEQAISMALQQMGVRHGQAYNVSSQQIIQQLAYTHTPANGRTTPQQRIASALSAYSGKEDVRLLRAWEYTLATHTESTFSHWGRENMAQAVLHGAPVPGAPHLQPLSAISGGMAYQLRHHPHYRGAAVDKVNQQLTQNIDHLMKTRFFMQYDADVAQKGVSNDGVSNRGGFVLYDRVPPNEPTKWQRIDNPAMFQQAMAHLVEEAAQRTSAQMGHLRGHPQVNQQALRTLTDTMKNHIGTQAFTDHAALRFNSPHINPPTVDPFNLPWQQARGGWSDNLVATFGGTSIHKQQFVKPVQAQAQATTIVGGQPEMMDSSHIMRFLAEGAMKMRPQLHAKAQQNNGDFKVPLNVPHHVCSFMPMQMADVWSGRQTIDQWMQTRLVAPAMQHIQARRTQPALFQLMQQLGRTYNMHPNEVNQIYQNIAAANGGMRHGVQSYTLDSVHKAFRQQYGQMAGGDDFLKHIEHSLLQAAPTPHTLFADTNWGDKQGNAVYMGAAYNPFRQRVESYFMDEHGGNRKPMEEKWLTGQWGLSGPVHSAARTA